MRIAILSFVALSACVAMQPVTQSKPVALSTSQITNIKATVTRDFFDPASAQFQNVRAADVVLSDGTVARRVCGEVNGKNQMGGYAGFELFGGELVSGQFVRRDFFAACE